VNRTRQLGNLSTPQLCRRRWLRHVPRYLLLCCVAVVTLGPFYWLLTISLRGAGTIYSFRLIPQRLTLANYAYVWTSSELSRAFFNSLIVAAGCVATNVIFSSLAAYPLARFSFPGKTLVFYAILSTLMVPFQLFLIPLYLLCLKLHMANSYIGVILPFSVGAFGIYLIKQFYVTIPVELEEAARVDGAGEFSIWLRIMFPLTKPAVAALSIFVFVWSWSSFLWPLVILSDVKKFTMPVAIAKLLGEFIEKTHYIAAGSVITVVPVIVLFVLLQRFFISGITLGAVKG
jgi:putative chitobiose transport system permease protein